MPGHVDMNPPPPQPVEQNVIAELTRANGIIDYLKQTSDNVIRLIRRLRENPSAADVNTIEDQLRTAFEVALYQGGVPPAIVPALAQMIARTTVRDIEIVTVQHGDSIVVYFLCKTIKAHYDLGQMIMSGFIHAVFAVAIESVASTTVDVYVRADEFNLRLLCLFSPQLKGV